jgi:hypothetical protein
MPSGTLHAMMRRTRGATKRTRLPWTRLPWRMAEVDRTPKRSSGTDRRLVHPREALCDEHAGAWARVDSSRSTATGRNRTRDCSGPAPKRLGTETLPGTGLLRGTRLRVVPVVRPLPRRVADTGAGGGCFVRLPLSKAKQPPAEGSSPITSSLTDRAPDSENRGVYSRCPANRAPRAAGTGRAVPGTEARPPEPYRPDLAPHTPAGRGAPGELGR